MKRSNFVIGIGASVVLHGVMLWTARGRASTAAPPIPFAATPVQIASLDPAGDPPPSPTVHADPDMPELDRVASVRAPVTTEPDPSPRLPAPPRMVPAPIRTISEAPVETENLERVASVRPIPMIEVAASTPPRIEPAPPPSNPRVMRDVVMAPPRALEVPTPPVESTPPPARREPSPPASNRTSTVDLPGVAGGATDDAAGLPPLRVHWQDAGDLRVVARVLGLRLGAVDGDRTVVAEIDLSDEPSLKPWPGLPPGYSSRVRMLSPSIFPARLGRDRGIDIREVWVFVPADRDFDMIMAQRAALRQAGARPRDVLSMDGRFVRTIDGSYRLDITNMRRR